MTRDSSRVEVKGQHEIVCHPCRSPRVSISSGPDFPPLLCIPAAFVSIQSKNLQKVCGQSNEGQKFAEKKKMD